MGMRETVGSMRAYFFLVGGLTVAVNGMILGRTGIVGPHVVIIGALAALFGAAFFYAAITLKTAIAYARTKAIEVILYANIAINVLDGLLALPGNQERHTAGIIRIVATSLIGFYLLVNLKRLVREHAAAIAEPVPTPPPPIPATQSPPEGESEGQAEGGD